MHPARKKRQAASAELRRRVKEKHRARFSNVTAAFIDVAGDELGSVTVMPALDPQSKTTIRAILACSNVFLSGDSLKTAARALVAKEITEDQYNTALDEFIAAKDAMAEFADAHPETTAHADE